MSYMLTTIDNPYNPFEQWDEWYAFDRSNYNSCGYLARMTNDINDDSMTEEEIDDYINNVMDRIIEQNGGLYMKVSREDYSKSA